MPAGLYLFATNGNNSFAMNQKTPAQYAAAPDTIAVREVLADGKLLVTTLLCPRETPKDALKLLYRQHWHAELDLRCLKTTLGMEALGCRTQAMAI